MKRLVAAILLAASPAAAETLDLRQAAAEALARNPQVVTSAAGVRIAEARRQGALAGWLPAAEVSASVTRGDNSVFVFGSLLEQGRFGAEHFDPRFLNDPDPLTNSRVALNVRYTFFDGFRRIAATRQAAHGVEQAHSAADEMRQHVLAQVIRAWYGVVVAEERRAVASRASEAAKAEADATRDRLAQGLVVESDLLAAEVHLASYRQQEIEAAADAAIARAGLAALLQRPLQDAVEIPRTVPQTPARAIPDLQRALEQGLSRRGAVAAAEAGRAIAHNDLTAARGALLPRLDGQATWGASGQTFAARNGDRTFGVVASLEVFNAGRWARIAESRAALEASKAAEAAARTSVSMEIISAHHRVRSAAQRVEVAGRAAEQAAEAARIVHDRYANGLTTITERLRAETAAVRAQLDLLGARFDEIVGYAELLRATGELNAVDPFL